jgi:hypothetical protein
MKNKGDFIIDLLSNKNLSTNDRERILKLSAKELEKSSETQDEIQLILEEFEKSNINFKSKIEENIEEIKSGNIDLINKTEKILAILESQATIKPTTDKNRIEHKPYEITRFLKNFEENTALKFSTHIWDKTDFLATYVSFIAKLNKEKKDYKFNDLFRYNRHLYNLLNYFLYEPRNIPSINGIPQFGWPNEELKDLKIGWQFPKNILKDWSTENYDLETNENKKYPMEMIVPIELKPTIRIKNKEVNSFEDVVNIFKTEIQFRNGEDNLYKQVKFSLSKNHLINSDLSVENLKDLHFYTYTRGIISAIDSIFISFPQENESYRDVSFEVISQSEYLEIKITHLNSFPDKPLEIENPNKFFSGNSLAIINHLFSLCDYSIISKFNNQDCIEIGILFDGSEGTPDGNNLRKLDTKMSVKIIDEEQVKGFTHSMKFYV